MLVLAPIMCILVGIAVSSTLANYVGNMEVFGSSAEKPKARTIEPTTGKGGSKGGKHREDRDNYPYKQEVFP